MKIDSRDFRVPAGKELKMAYPETTVKRRQELAAIRKQLAK